MSPSPNTGASGAIAIVLIGRNEGVRLEPGLRSAAALGGPTVYVDSGSTDDSVAIARRAGADIVVLSDDKPFSAARGRNAGFRRIIETFPDTQFILFMDGDCEIVADFVATAHAIMQAEPDVGLVAGRTRERFRDETVYNLVCDMEWDCPTGDVAATAGRFLARVAATADIGGFDPSVIAAEDDDFCIRMRAAGWRVRQIADDMCIHDAAMTRFGQWWRRAFRAGHGYEQVASLHEGYFAAPRRRAVLWGGALPAAAILLAPFTGGFSFALFLLYPLSFARTAFNLVRGGAALRDAMIYSGFLTISKFPNLLGMISYRRKAHSSGKVTIVEYK